MKRGFTLIELLAATAMAVLLMFAGFQVIASLGRTRAALARQAAHRSFVPQMLEMLRWDLTNARFMKAGQNELILTGYGGLDRSSLRPTQRPVTVRYHIETAAGQEWLVRDQTDLDVTSNRNHWSTLVCAGIGGFEVQSVAAFGKRRTYHQPHAGGIGQHLASADRTGWQGPALGLDCPADQDEVPDRLWFIIHTDEPTDPIIQKLIYAR